MSNRLSSTNPLEKESMSATRKSVPDGALSGRVALISGAARGIGLAIAERFQYEGARVFLLDCDTEAGSRAAEELSARLPGNPATFLTADLAREVEVQEAI